VECFFRLVLFEVKREGLLRAVEPDKVTRHPLHGPVVGAGEVAHLRALHLYNARPEVGELAGGERGGDGLLQRDDGDAF
jgi:hypothetical protein